MNTPLPNMLIYIFKNRTQKLKKKKKQFKE